MQATGNNEFQKLVRRLKDAGIHTQRFLKLQTRSKKAFEPEWQIKLYSPEQFGDYQYWGICAKDDCFFVDTDRTEMQDIIREKLPATLEVQSPRRELSQFLFKAIGEPIPNKDLILPGEQDASGEIRAQNEYIVAAGTEIDFQDLLTGEPRSGIYKIIQDRPIALISSVEFMQIITPYLGKDTTQKITYEHMRQGVLAGRRHKMGIKYANFLIGVKQFDAATALREMEQWNNLCRPPMPHEDIERIVRDAINYQSKRPTKPGSNKNANGISKSEVKGDTFKSEPQGLWPEIPEPLDYGTDEQLDQELLDYVKARLELTGDKEYATFIAFIKLTWLINKFDTTPYLFFFGPKRSGKSRALQILKQLCCKAMKLENVSRAAIYFAVDKYHPTLLLDEAETYTGKSDDCRDIQRLLNSGYERGGVVMRLDKDSHGNPKERFYDTFGPKAFAGTRYLMDTLTDRCIVFKMTKNSYRVEPIDVDQARTLRGKLAKWQIDQLTMTDQEEARANTINGATNKYTLLPELTDERLRQLFCPLHIVVKLGQLVNGVEANAEKQQASWNEELKLTFDAEILEIIGGLSKPQDKFTARQVAEVYNVNKSEDEQVTAKSTGYVIGRLGFERTRLTDSNKAWQFDPDLFNRRKYQFNLAFDPQQKLSRMGTVDVATKAYLPRLGTCLVLPPSYF